MRRRVGEPGRGEVAAGVAATPREVRLDPIDRRRLSKLLPLLVYAAGGCASAPRPAPETTGATVSAKPPGGAASSQSAAPATAPTEKPRVYCWLIADPRCDTGEAINAC